jgi:hypothetical protein
MHVEFSEGSKFSVWFGNRGMRSGYSVGVEEQVFKTIEQKQKKLYPYYTLFLWDFIAENNWHIDKKTKMAEDEKQQCM